MVAEDPEGGWRGLGTPAPLPSTVASLLRQTRATVEGVFHLEVARRGRELLVDVVVDRDGWLACARPIAVLVRSCGRAGATGAVRCVGFDGTTDAWRVDAPTGVITALEPGQDEEVLREIVEGARSRLWALAEGTTSPGSGGRDEAAALRALARTDAEVAVERALAVLAEPDAFHQRSRFPAAEAAREVLVEHARGSQAVRAAEAFLPALFTLGGSGYDAWAAQALAHLDGPAVAARLADELTSEGFARRVVGTMKLFDVLVARREMGDAALLDALADDPWSHFAGSSLPDALVIRICERACDVRAAARGSDT